MQKKNFYILDPDLINLQEDYWFAPKFGKITKPFSMDSKSRISKAIVYGGEFKNGDNLSNQSNVEIVKKYFGNSRVNEMWMRSKTGLFNTSFRPISWEAEKTIIPLLPNIIPPSTYIRENGDIVIFNFGLFGKIYTIDFNETKLSDVGSITCEDLWENKKTNINNNSLFNSSIPLDGSIISQNNTFTSPRDPLIFAQNTEN